MELPARVIVSVRHNLARLASFSGRDTRAQFWPYAIVIFVLLNLAMVAIIAPQIVATIHKMQQFAMQHPDQVTVVQSQTSYSMTIHGSHPELMPNFGAIFHAMIPIIAVFVALYAAAVARRLHDRGKTGLLGLLPLPFLAYGFVEMPRLLTENPLAIGQIFALFVNNVLYLASLVLVIFLLAGPSAPEDNRYGPVPAR